jgi:hypothetical protein
MCERALTAIYHFQKGWIIQSFSGILPVACFFPKKKVEYDGSFQKFGNFGDSSLIVCFFPPKN